MRLADGESLLRRWAAVSGPAFREASRFASPIPDPDELAIRLTERLNGMGVGYALSRLAAVRFVEPYAPARVVDVYVDREPGELEAPLDLCAVDRGESVRLVRPSDAGVLQFTAERQGVTVVNPVQLFVDLEAMGVGGRVMWPSGFWRISCGGCGGEGRAHEDSVGIWLGSDPSHPACRGGYLRGARAPG